MLRTPLQVRLRQPHCAYKQMRLMTRAQLIFVRAMGQPGLLSTQVPSCAARYHEKLMLAAQHSDVLVAAFARNSDLAGQPSAQITFNLGALLLCSAMLLSAQHVIGGCWSADCSPQYDNR